MHFKISLFFKIIIFPLEGRISSFRSGEKKGWTQFGFGDSGSDWFGDSDHSGIDW